MLNQAMITIPQKIRDDLFLNPGVKIEYVKEENPFFPKYRIQQSLKPFWGKRQNEYLISSQGQVTVPKYILDELKVQSKDELILESSDEGLVLTRSPWHQFQDIILEYRPRFYSDIENDSLMIVTRNEEDPQVDRFVFVNAETFELLKHLYRRLQLTYGSDNQKDVSWVRIPYAADQGISIAYENNGGSTNFTVTKLGGKYLADSLLSRLWTQRIPFRMDHHVIHYLDGKEQISESTNSKNFIQVLGVFRRNAKKIGKDHSTLADPRTVIIELFSGDLVIFHDTRPALEFWPINIHELER